MKVKVTGISVGQQRQRASESGLLSISIHVYVRGMLMVRLQLIVDGMSKRPANSVAV